jgi:leucyl-tRNA synthetase
MDLRVSGKDLIQNHLIFALYNHVALFAQSQCPRGMRANGHMNLDGEKMSKSTGNFLTLTQAIDDFSADGMRLTLADCSDSIDDANFERKSADRGLLRLHTQIKWVEEQLANAAKLRDPSKTVFEDSVFENEINRAICDTDQHYAATNFRDGLLSGFWNFQTARDTYRTNCGSQGMRRDLVMRFIEVQFLLLTPITPHLSEYVWKLLGKVRDDVTKERKGSTN